MKKNLAKSNGAARRKGLFPTKEKPSLLRGWKPEHGLNRIGVVERDIADLMRKLAAAQAGAEEMERGRFHDVQRLLLALLDILDAFERVFAAIDAKKELCTGQMMAWVGNFRTVHMLLNKVLTERGVSRLESLGREFDPHLHEVDRKQLDLSKPVGTILQEIKKGYLWPGNQLLRHARVVVVTHTVAEESPQEDEQP